MSLEEARECIRQVEDDTYIADELNLSGLGLQELPSELWELSNPTFIYLYLDGNALTTLPSEIGELINIETLILHGNTLTTLPPEIG